MPKTFTGVAHRATCHHGASALDRDEWSALYPEERGPWSYLTGDFVTDKCDYYDQKGGTYYCDILKQS
jgi:hypothetical protein